MKLFGKGDEAVLREGAHKMALLLKEGIERCTEAANEFLQESHAPEMIYLTGGASHTPFLVSELSSLLGVQVEHLLPIRKIDLHPNLNSQQVYEISSQLSVAIGTGVIGTGLSGI